MHDTILAHEVLTHIDQVSIKPWGRLSRGKGFPKHDTMVQRKNVNCHGFEKMKLKHFRCSNFMIDWMNFR